MCVCVKKMIEVVLVQMLGQVYQMTGSQKSEDSNKEERKQRVNFQNKLHSLHIFV